MSVSWTILNNIMTHSVVESHIIHHALGIYNIISISGRLQMKGMSVTL